MAIFRQDMQSYAVVAFNFCR